MTRGRIIGGVAAIIVIAWCYLPLEMTPVGGGWHTTFSSHFPESGGTIRLYRRGPLAIRIRVADRASVKRFYPPDCIVYGRGGVGTIYAACGSRLPVPVAYSAPWQTEGDYEADSTGLRRIDKMRVVDGVAVASVERIAIADMRRAAESRAPFFPGWSLFVGRSLGAVQPAMGDEPVDVLSRGPGGTTPLMEAVRGGQLDVVDAMLRMGADVNASDSLSTTPLLMAINIFHTETALVGRLIDAGADINVRDHTRRTPLMLAATIKHTAVFRLLLERGADPCGRDEFGTNIVDDAEGPFPELRQMAIAAYARCP